MTLISPSMLLRRGGFRDVCFVSSLDRWGAIIGDLCQLDSVGDWAAVSAHEHGPAASGAARLAPHCRCTHFRTGFTDGLHSSHRDGTHPLAAT